MESTSFHETSHECYHLPQVRFWVTFNEPYMFCVFGHGHGRLGATRVNPGTSEYLCGHHILLAHARAYRAYQQSFSHQGGKVGLTLEDFYTVPDSQKAEDVLAAEVHQQFQLGWFLDPILAGDYPELMRQRVGANGAAGGGRAASRLPTFTEAERRLLAGALDFLGLNVYFGWRARHGVPVGAADPSVERDAAYTIIGTADQFLPPGPFRSTPWAVRRSLGWVRKRYGRELPIIITENGFGDDGAEGLQDEARIGYLQDHLREVMRAVHEDRHNIKGYFVWCLLDDFEWGAGYKSKFGLVHVDFESGTLNRTPKASLLFYKRVIEHRMLADDAVATGPSSSSSSSRPFDVRMLVVAVVGSMLCARA
ncbi:lactase/phlorizin hydrolase-like [Frankliniella occidentalis]|uniref:beta-glucosidase n=1 Tax=Frankliniella occidentalis TaxID=133901 RepID=A0A9C6U823_FRAOC|nr:lactase/phlorizin hydrolase-like [Frankliniella occidentalis]